MLDSFDYLLITCLLLPKPLQMYVLTEYLKEKGVLYNDKENN